MGVNPAVRQRPSRAAGPYFPWTCPSDGCQSETCEAVSTVLYIRTHAGCIASLDATIMHWESWYPSEKRAVPAANLEPKCVVVKPSRSSRTEISHTCAALTVIAARCVRAVFVCFVTRWAGLRQRGCADVGNGHQHCRLGVASSAFIGFAGFSVLIAKWRIGASSSGPPHAL